ncbi:MAG: hypothetical protein ACI9SJ_001567 [Flavobacteriaceae bacterium]|jgi:hypothetical protein|uniref:hypothetical protein n=1 Tax=Candidatus Marifrigoribacter sp. Uisw_064 TaxID=3230970 RepID=UPI003AE135E3
MKTLYRTIFILLCIPAIAFANNEIKKGKHTKEKTIKKEFTVNPDALLKVNNSYGNIDIVTWNENRTVIEVKITTNGNDEEKVQKRLDNISIEFSGSNSLVSAKTHYGNKKKSSWSWWSKNNTDVNIEVNYTIKLPITNSVDLNNNYGAILITKLEGVAKINCDYGQLIIGELLADNNSLNFDYTNKSTIEYMKSGKIIADYSSFSIDKAENIELNADYTKSEIGEVLNINYNCDYGKVKIDKAANVDGKGDYVTNKLGIVSGSLKLNTDYGSISTERIQSTAKNTTITADYTNIKIGFDAGYNFDFTINLTYASLKGDDYVNIKHSSNENGKKKYSGYHGSKNSGNTMTINSEYGSVTLNKI